VAEVLLFHHAQGLTPGVVAIAERLRAAGHVVHAPDLYEGRTFGELSQGVAHAERTLGTNEVVARAARAAEALPAELVYVGFSLGVVPAQRLAQTRPGAKGAVLFGGALALSWFGGAWPDGARLQVHAAEPDEWVEWDDTRQTVAAVPGAELFAYPGAHHLFVDGSLPAHDPAAASLFEKRVLAFLAGVG